MSALELHAILPYLQENAIASIPLPLVLSLLSNPSIISSASNTDRQHLCSRITTLLKSNQAATRWRATKIFTICLNHSLFIVSPHTVSSLAALVKILESKSYIKDVTNPPQQEIVTLNSTIECVDILISHIRGKPTLTREVLTPKLPAVIAALIALVTIVPQNVVPVLYKLLLFHTTTFRPFGAKFEKELRYLLGGDENLTKFPKQLKETILKSLAFLSFGLSKNNLHEIWKERVDDLILELKSVISIYEACLELNEDRDYITRCENLPNLPQDLTKLKMMFAPLDIDINESPLDIFKVSRRIQILVEMLLAYINTSTSLAVKIPLGHYVIISEILAGFNLNFTPVKRDIRDFTVREMIAQSIMEVRYYGVQMLNNLVQIFHSDMYPHLYSIMAVLDAAIPVKSASGKIKTDVDKVVENKTLISHIVDTAGNYLELVERFNDMSVLNKIIDASLILSEPRTPLMPDETGDMNSNITNQLAQASGFNRNSKKKAKNKNSISFSDLLSHTHLFVVNPSSDKIHMIRKFFKIAVARCELSTGKMSAILRFTILDAVANKNILKNGVPDNKNRDLMDLLETVLLFPGQSESSVSILPIISNLIGENKLLSILTNPRFPLFPKKVQSAYSILEEQGEDYVNSEDEGHQNSDTQEPYNVVEKRRPEVNDEENDAKRRQTEKVQKVEQDYNDLVFKDTNSVSGDMRMLHPQPVEQLVECINVDLVRLETVEKKGHEEDEEIESDFEIPEINVDDDDD